MSSDSDAQPTRRAVLRTAAWSVPAVTVLAAAPAFAASSSTVNVGAFQLNGTCGAGGGLINVGFIVRAGAVALPVGTLIDITATNVATIELFTASGVVCQIGALDRNRHGQHVVLAAPLLPGKTLTLTSKVSVAVLSRIDAALALPTGYVAGAGAKAAASVVQTAPLICKAS